MDKICERDVCTGCGLCSNVCPTQAICFKADEEGFVFPVIDDNKCINCARCYKSCPSNNDMEYVEPRRIIAAWSNNEEIIMHSSSGGAFSSLANIVFRMNGVVAGVYYDKLTNTLKHGVAMSVEEIDAMRLSKYYQSNTGNIYQRVKKYLSERTIVLFTGTACQVAAMQSCVTEEERKFLITADILCHGVTNDKVVKAYLKSKERIHKAKIKDFVFRVKSGSKGWWGGGGAKMRLIFENGDIIDTDNQLDTYFVGFNNSLFLRECCYNCHYAGINRISDFTLADYWGAEYDDRFDGKRLYSGISLILVNSQKGEDLLEGLSHEMTLLEANRNLAIENNRSLVSSYPRNKNRNKFFEFLNKGKDYDGIIRKLFRKYYILFYMRKLLLKAIGKHNYEKVKRILKG